MKWRFDSHLVYFNISINRIKKKNKLAEPYSAQISYI